MWEGHYMTSGQDDQRFAALCDSVPGTSVYPTRRFRTEWGPIFFRGRLDGTARVLVIGQDPAAHEAMTRRILVGEAGHRVQGFLWKLGIDRSYVMINSFVYSLYGTSAPKPTPKLLEDRYKWLDLILETSPIEAVVTFGGVATSRWQGYVADRQPASVPVQASATHPTARVDEATLLANWNTALKALFPAITGRDRATKLKLYKSAVAASERRAIPAFDLPAGMPRWMAAADEWAVRGDGRTKAPKASRITVTIPSASRAVR